MLPISTESPGFTWNEIGILATIFGVVIVPIVGWFWHAISDLQKKHQENSKLIEDYRIKVAENYATIETVVKIEERLTNSINRMSDQIGTALTHLTTRVEASFTQIMNLASSAK